MKIILTLLFSTFIASADAISLSIQSDPGKSVVYLRELGSTSKIKLGETPLLTSFEELFNNYLSNHHFVLVVEKEGYFPYEVILSDLNVSDTDLEVRLEIKEDFNLYKGIDALAGELFDAQKQIRNKNYKDAISKLIVISEKQPTLSIIPELIGSAYYMQKDLVKALEFYTRAYRINPENRDAYTMKQFLEKTLGMGTL